MKFYYDIKETNNYVFIKLIYSEIVEDFENKKFNSIFLEESTTAMYDIDKVKRKYQVFSSVIASAVLSSLIDKDTFNDNKVAFHVSWNEFPLYEINKDLFEIT